MSYNTEMDRQYKRGLAEGWRKGIAEGKAQGSGQVNKLIKLLMSEKKYDELEKSAEDESYQKELMKNMLTSTRCLCIILFGHFLEST